VLGRDHALSAALAFTALAPVLHVTGPAIAAGAVFTAGAGVLPDIDEPGSTIARQGGFLTGALSWIVHRASGGHRKLTHSVAGVGIFALLAWIAVRFDATPAAQVTLGLFVALLLAAGMHALRLGGHYGDILAVAGAVAVVHWHVGLALVPVCIAIGAAAHIAGDELTHDGCPLGYPFSGHEFHLLPHRLQITTGKAAEHWIVTPLLLAALGYLAWRDTGIGQIVHVHLAGHVAR
jgi:membrane-bound metal-dependent hydrolase YbcI (DUF457 family)